MLYEVITTSIRDGRTIQQENAGGIRADWILSGQQALVLASGESPDTKDSSNRERTEQGGAADRNNFV